MRLYVTLPQHPNTADKIGGTVEQIKGKILHKPEVAQHGLDRKTGALEEKKALQDDKEDPFKKEEDSPAGTTEAAKESAASSGTKPSEGTASRVESKVAAETAPRA